MKTIITARFFLLVSTTVSAVCLKGNPSVEQDYADSQGVFIGKVIEKKHVAESRDYYDGDEYTLQVQEVLKGQPSDRISIFSENSSGRFLMTPGNTYLLFTYVELGRFQISNCGNSGVLSEKKNAVLAVRTLKQRGETKRPHMICQVKVPSKYQKTPGNPPPNGEPEPIRYQKSFEAFWWNCVMVKANNLDARCPFTCSGTPAAVAGCSDGESDAENKIADLLNKFSRSDVTQYLRSLASTEEAKKKIYPYFQETPQPEKVQ